MSEKSWRAVAMASLILMVFTFGYRIGYDRGVAAGVDQMTQGVRQALEELEPNPKGRYDCEQNIYLDKDCNRLSDAEAEVKLQQLKKERGIQ